MHPRRALRQLHLQIHHFHPLHSLHLTANTIHQVKKVRLVLLALNQNDLLDGAPDHMCIEIFHLLLHSHQTPLLSLLVLRPNFVLTVESGC